MKNKKIALLLAFLLFSFAFFASLMIPAAADGECTITVIVKIDETTDTEQKAGTVSMTAPQSQTVIGTQMFQADNGKTYEFQVTVNEGYSFKRWTIRKNEETPTYTGAVTYSCDVDNGNHYTLTATFLPNTYVIDYHPDDYEGPAYVLEGFYSEEHVYGTPTTLPKPVLSNGKQTHTFSGWVAKSGGNEIRYGTDAVLGANEYTSDIELTPEWSPNSFYVTRIDGYLKNGEFQPFEGVQPVKEKAVYGTAVSGNTFGEERFYRGYRFDEEATFFSQPVIVSDDEEKNVVYRLYCAKEYDVSVQNAETVGDWQVPIKHIYGEDLYLSAPVRDGYTFTGWTVDRAKDPLDQSVYRLQPQPDGTYLLEGTAFDSAPEAGGKILLTAEWQANSYPILYDTDTLYGFDTASLPDSRLYNRNFTLDVIPVRNGYTFDGWHLKGTDASRIFQVYTIPAETKPAAVTFEAIWSAKTYEITFLTFVTKDGTHSTEPDQFQMPKVSVVYGQKPASIDPPTCTGYTFGGYQSASGTLLFLPDGSFNPDVGVWNLSESTSLSAVWTKNKYSIRIQIETGIVISYQCLAITVNGAPYDPLDTFDFESKLELVLTVKDGFPGRLVKWNGEDIPHTDSLSVSLTVPAANQTYVAVVLQKETTPSLGIDYGREILTGFKPGDYRISTNDGAGYAFRYHSDGTFTGTRPNPSKISDFFGTTVLISRMGDGETTADSDPQRISLAPRMDAPTGEIVRVNTEEIGVIRLEMGNSEPIYEFAWTTDPVQNEDAITNWQDSPDFENLDSDTVYYVYVRAKAKTGISPHGTSAVLQVRTSGETTDAFVILLLLSIIALLQVAAILLLILRRRANRNATVHYSLTFPLMLSALPAMAKGDRIAVLVLAGVVIGLQILLTVLLLRTFVFKPHWTQPLVIPEKGSADEAAAVPENPGAAEGSMPEPEKMPDEQAEAQSTPDAKGSEPADEQVDDVTLTEPADPTVCYPADGTDQIPTGEVPLE